MKILLLLCLLNSTGFAEPQDPRAVSISKVRGVEENVTSGYRCDSTAFSIVIYGAPDSTGVYRIEGIDRALTISELTDLLKSFYSGFPKDATTPDKRMGAPIPLPNILYASGGWNEMKEDGRSLVTGLSREYGVALYYFGIVPGYEISFNPLPGVPIYELACIEYYQKRLNVIADPMKDPKQQPAGANKPSTHSGPKSEGSEKPQPGPVKKNNLNWLLKTGAP